MQKCQFQQQVLSAWYPYLKPETLASISFEEVKYLNDKEPNNKLENIRDERCLMPNSLLSRHHFLTEQRRVADIEKHKMRMIQGRQKRARS